MEKCLRQLSQNTVALRYRVIHEHVQLTLDTLDTQKVSYAFKAWQIREKCLAVLKLALESNNPTLCDIGLHGIDHLVLNPDLDGYAGAEELDSMDSRIFVLQVLDSLNHLPSLSDDQQLHGLKILIGLSCDFVSSFDGELIIKIVQMCLACWHKDKTNILSAMLQLLASYTLHTQKLCTASCRGRNVDLRVHCAAESLASQAVERLANADISNIKSEDKLADVIGLAKFFVQQIRLASSDSQRGIYLECLLAVLKTLESNYIRRNEMFSNYVRQNLCPTLASVISSDATDSQIHVVGRKKKKRRNKTNYANVTQSSILHKKVALLCIELVRLVGCVASLRPQIALVFTHLLSPSTCHKHGIPFSIINKLCSTPAMLYDLAGPFLVQDLNVKQNYANILQMIIEAMLALCASKVEDSVSSQFTNIHSTIEVITSLLHTLDEAKQGIGMREEQVVRYYERNEELDSSDENISFHDDSESCKVTTGDSRLCLSDDDDLWQSSEDVYTALSSPSYLSAVEDPEEINEIPQNNQSSKGFDLMTYMTRQTQAIHKTNPEEASSTCTASSSGQDDDSDGDIAKYLEDVLLPDHEPDLKATKLVDAAINQRNCILARRHFESLVDILPELLQYEDVASIDQALQKAASRFCSDIHEKWITEQNSIQADSLYTLSYSILLLCLRLKLSGHYSGTGVHLPCVKSQWVAYQQSSGVYLSKSWLSETFRQIITTDILEKAHYDESLNEDVPRLLVLLGEIDGLGHINMEISSDVKPLKDAPKDFNPAVQSGLEFARQIVTSVWSDVLQTLQHPLRKILNFKEDLSTALFLILSPSSLRIRSETERDIIISSIDGLRFAFKLSCGLGLHSYSSSVLSRIVEVCVPSDFASHHSIRNSTADDNEGINLRLHMSHVLCMDAVLDVALEVGSNFSKSWEELFRVVSYIAYLDYLCFHDSSNFEKNKEFLDSASLHDMDIGRLVSESNTGGSWSSFTLGSSPSTSMGFLTHATTAKSVYALSRNVDRLFEKAALELSLRSLTEFMWTMCVFSHQQLYKGGTFTVERQVYGTPLLYRVGECMLQCVRSPARPLLHISSIWRYASPHFTKVTGHQNLHFAKQAVTYIHDVVSAVLTHPDEMSPKHPLALWRDHEPKHYHFNESLLVPYERAMQAETCEPDIQNLIIRCISQLVETSSKQICSGWRPLFSALKHLTYEDIPERSPVVEVLNAYFVASNSPRVFASAAHDCLNCLLKMLSTSLGQHLHPSSPTSPIIRYLEEIGITLMQLHESGNTEKFRKACHVDTAPLTSGDGDLWRTLTSPMWLDMENKAVEQVMEEMNDVTEKCFTRHNANTTDSPHRHCPDLDDASGLLRTWFALMDGLTTRVLIAHHHLQPSVLNLLCKLLDKSWTVPGPSYCFHVLQHSCLPTLLTWMDKIVRGELPEHENNLLGTVMSYKLMFGTIMELTASFIHRYFQGGSRDSQLNEQIDCIWKSYLNLCAISVQTRKEALAKLGCACIRLVVSVLGKCMTSSMIEDVVGCMRYLVEESLFALSSLTTFFDVYPDASEHLTAEPRDSASIFCDSASLLRAFQSMTSYKQKDDLQRDVEVYSSSLYKLKTRISMCSLACDVSTLYLLAQCIEFTLLGDSRLSWERFLLHSQQRQTKVNNEELISDVTSSLHSTSLDDVHEEVERDSSLQLFDRMNTSQVYRLAECVVRCFVAARNFDAHHHLQRFVQRISKFYNAANLYQFAERSYNIHLRIILAVCCRRASDQDASLSQHHFSGSSPPFNSSITVEDLLPGLWSFRDENLASMKKSDEPKSSSDIVPPPPPAWAYVSLYKTVSLLCRGWEDTPLLEHNSFPASEDAVSNQDEDGGDHVAEDNESKHSLEINFDYMAYVKRTNPPSDAVNTDASQSSKNTKANKRARKLASERISRLISAYKQLKQNRGSISPSEQDNTDANSPSSTRRSRTASESSSIFSLVALDEKILERQVWSMMVGTTLKLLTSAPDHALSWLLPIVYRPLASLANYRPPHPLPLLGGDEHDGVGSAFHKWLLRVGDFCEFSTLK